LQGAFAGRVVVGESAVQDHANQAGSPKRVLAAQGQGRLHDRLRWLGGRGPAVVIVGEHGGLALMAETVDQPSDGARGQSQGLGDGGAILAVLVAPPDGQAHGYGEGTRHGPSSRGVAAIRTRP
jgi:hypothetical protein